MGVDVPILSMLRMVKYSTSNSREKKFKNKIEILHSVFSSKQTQSLCLCLGDSPAS